MLVLQFSVGSDRYAVAAAGIVEVLPLLGLKALPALPPEVAGLLDYRGVVVPVIDLHHLLLGSACPPLLSSRILLTRYLLPDGAERILGLCVERASAARRVAPDAWRSSTVRTPPWLGPVALEESGMIQLIEPQTLLTRAVRERLFPPAADPAEAIACHADSAAD